MMRWWWLLLPALVPGGAQAAACEAKSGGGTAALVELYTSEGCSSCPPADAWLSRLAGRGAVPLAFHVDYWDYIGWKDRFADPAWSARQREAARASGARVVYTPQVMLNGRDFRGWSSEAIFSRELAALAARSPGADLRLALQQREGGTTAALEVTLREPRHARAWVALYENRLASEVQSGENAGRSLGHDWVVRRLEGPFPVPASGRLELEQPFELQRDWKRADLGVAAFVTDPRGAVLQAVQRPFCAAGG